MEKPKKNVKKKIAEKGVTLGAASIGKMLGTIAFNKTVEALRENGELFGENDEDEPINATRMASAAAKMPDGQRGGNEDDLLAEANTETESGQHNEANAETGDDLLAEANTETESGQHIEANAEIGDDLLAEANTETESGQHNEANAETGDDLLAEANAETGDDPHAEANTEAENDQHIEANAETGDNPPAETNAGAGDDLLAEANAETENDLPAEADDEPVQEEDMSPEEVEQAPPEAPQNHEPSVEVLDYNIIQDGDDGSMDMATVRVDGTCMAVIDVDQDGYGDVLVVDANDDQLFDEDDSFVDITDNRVPMSGFYEVVEQRSDEIMDGVGDDVPVDDEDYVNDADTTDFMA